MVLNAQKTFMFTSKEPYIYILLDLLKGDICIYIYIFTYFAGSLKGAIELFIDLLKGDIYYCWSPQRRHV